MLLRGLHPQRRFTLGYPNLRWGWKAVMKIDYDQASYRGKVAVIAMLMAVASRTT